MASAMKTWTASSTHAGTRPSLSACGWSALSPIASSTWGRPRTSGASTPLRVRGRWPSRLRVTAPTRIVFSQRRFRRKDCYSVTRQDLRSTVCASRVFFCAQKRQTKRTERSDMAKVDYRSLAGDILHEVGGEGNIAGATHCATRLRLKLRDEAKADKAAIE